MSPVIGQGTQYSGITDLRLLQQLQAAVVKLEAEIATAKASVKTIEEKIVAIEAKIVALEKSLKELTEQRGVVEITWPGAAPKSNTLTIVVTKGLLLRPFFTPFQRAALVTSWFPVLESRTETELKVFGFCPEGSPGAGKSSMAWWLS